MINYGEGGTFAVRMDGPFGSSGGGGASKITSINVLKSAWKGAASPYSQVVTVEGISVNSKVDLQLPLADLESIHNRDITFFAVNDNGIVTIYAIGDRPANDMVFQAVLTEVSA